MLTILYILLLTAGFCWLLKRILRNRSAILSNNELYLVFGVKVVAGVSYGYIFGHYFGGDDTWFFHHQGLEEKIRLLQQPALFFSDFNPLLPFQRNATFSAGLRNLLSDWEYLLVMKPLAFFNLVSGGNYYINIVFFSFITFWGHYWFYELLVKFFPLQRKTWLVLVFMFPPVVFWLSGLRGDPLLFLFLTLALNRGYKWMQTRNPQQLTGSLLGLLGVMIMRDPVALLLFPALLSVYITVKYKMKAWKVWIPVYVSGIVVFFLSAGISREQNLPMLVVQKQAEFFLLHSNNRMALDTLHPSVTGFAKVLPQATVNTFFRPLPWEAKGPLQLVASADILFFWFLFIWSCYRGWDEWKVRLSHPFLLFLLVFGVCLYIFIGYTVPFPGAIVRYKIIPELFLLTCLLYTNNKKLHI
ncbi:MAG: hypothetical protein ACTHMC_16585 [Pseudobacter sp.]|uniref:hypothetical protein n=1 Tax=Pseudobacter sp. TaxID=2045420 RepID=UPI003F814EBE